jgi:dTDP-6-deoxy-L-talose 4-dehydrogenase (NAD+)
MYGVGQSGCSLFSMLRDAVARGDRVFDMSGGEQVRDYLPVQEVARVIVQLALSGADLGTVNICSGKPVSVRNLVKGWLTENGWEIQLNLGHFPYPDYEPMTFWGDDTKLQKILRINQ